MVRSGTSRGSTGSTGGDKRYKYGPSLVPLPQRPYDMIEEQNTAIVKFQVDAHFVPKPPPQPKEKVPEKVIDHFIHMARKPAPKPVDSDYERQIMKAHRARLQKEASSSSSQQAAVKNAGKPFPSWENRRRNRSPRLLCQQHVTVRAPNIIVGKQCTFPRWAMW